MTSSLRTSLRCLLLTCVCLASPVQAEAPPKVLRYAYEIAETGFDPAQLSDLYSRNIAGNIFDAPLRFAYLAKPGTVEPNTLAAMPEVSADFKTFTFHLRAGIYFTDDPVFGGKKRELVAQDYVYSLKRHYDPRWKSYAIGELEPLDILGMNALRSAAVKGGKFDYDHEVDGLRALDRYTFRIMLGKPNPRFHLILADPSLMGAVAREVIESDLDKTMEHPVGTGPFKLAEWRRSSFIALERNRDYRDDFLTADPDPTDASAVAMAAALKGRKLPIIDRVEISIIEESQPRWLSFLNGEADYMERVPYDLTPLAIPNNQLSPALAKKHVAVERRPQIDVAFAVYNMDNPVIGGYTPEHIALRRALNLALDSNEMIRLLYKFQAIPAQSMLMPATTGYDPDLRTEMGETDVAKANALLDAWGYADRDGDGWRDQPDGSPLVLKLSTQPDQRSRISDEVWKKSMDHIKVKVEFETAKWPENLRKTRNGQYMIWWLGLSATGPDSSPSFRQAYGPSTGAENLARFKNATYDRIYEEQDQMPDGPDRVAKLRELQRLFVAYAPMNAICHRLRIDLNYPWVLNRRSWPFVRDWWRYVDIDNDFKARAH
jgi:ABC-type transport system substrate-binding protein